MKKIFSISLMLAGALAFTACVHEEDDIFDKSAAERLNEASDVYSARLGASPNGWAMQYYPTYENEYPYGSGYLILMDFNDDGSVTVGMNNRFTNNKYLTDTSLWEVITDDGPVLSFNSYNKCMHAFSDPEDIPWTGSSDEPNDEQGEGVGGDYEFIVVDAPEDASYLMLKGKKRGTYNLLTPVEEGVEYESYLDDIINFQNTYFSATSPTYDVFHLGGVVYKVEGANDGLPNIYPFDGDAVADESFNPFLITKRGEDYYLRFRDKKDIGDGQTVQDFRYNAEKDIFESVDYPENYIEGDNPLRFANYVLTETTQRFQIDAKSDMSDAFRSTYWESIQSGFSSVKYTLQNIQLRIIGGQLLVRISYKAGSNTNVDYNLSLNTADDTMSFTYEGTKPAGQNILNAIPAIGDLISFLGRNLKITAGQTTFNLSQIKFTDSNDESLWFVGTLY